MGGTLSFFLRLLEIHKKNGIKTAVLIQKMQYYPELFKIFNENEVTVYCTRNRSKWMYLPIVSYVIDVIFCYKAFWDFRPDIIHISSGTSGLMLGAFIFPCSLIYTVHSYPMSQPCTRFNYLLKCKSSLRKRFLTVSQFSANQINKYWRISNNYIDVIYNSFTKKIINDKTTKDNLVLTIGHVVWYKNPELWIKVAQKVITERNDIKFIWLGEGPLLEKMREKVLKLKLEKSILFKGYCDHTDHYYMKALIYFQPSLIESHGISVVDAMAYGIPCIASNIGGLPESIIHNETGFICDPKDTDGFAQQIIMLLDDSELRNTMAQKGKERAYKCFSSDIQETKIIELYRKVSKQ